MADNWAGIAETTFSDGIQGSPVLQGTEYGEKSKGKIPNPQDHVTVGTRQEDAESGLFRGITVKYRFDS